ncbi:MAG: uL15m family ribosomal protein [Candidatus Woesearchaeota archaeon]
MTVNKRKKNSRQRGSMTHGWGAKKKHRGAGNRGGRGMAGSGKRADQKKPSLMKDKHYFGKHGFVNKQRKTLRCINIEELQRLGKDTINLTELGYDKLLSKGKATAKYKITAKYATPKAKEKIEKAGGTIN